MADVQCAERARATESLRVLIIDDDADQAEGMVDLLAPRGYRTAVARGAEQARARLATFDAQVALVDIRLGAESGIDLAAELRDSHPEILCVMITAYANLDNTIESLQQRVFDFLRKPLSPAALFACLDRCAERIRLEREKAEVQAALRESEAMLNDTGAIARIGGWEHDLVTGKAVWTKALYDVLELAAEDPPGVDEHLAFYTPDSRRELEHAYRRAVGQCESFDLELQGYTARRRAIWCRVIGRPIVEDGQCTRLRGTFQDITERKRAEKEREDLIEQLEAQNAELERFTYTASHDLKTPLITIRGFIGMLEKDLQRQDDQAVRDDLARISGAADKMGHLLADLLELSRIGRLTNPPEQVPLEELCHEALGLLHGPTEENHVRVDILPGLPTAFGDRLRLREVMQNLIDNAVKYMGDQAEPRVEIGCRQDGNATVCYVRDNGVGIEARHHERVFDLFEQLDPAVEGSGIGLALVKRIIEVHGGQIWVESEGAGTGATFCFTVPLSHEDASPRRM